MLRANRLNRRLSMELEYSDRSLYGMIPLRGNIMGTVMGVWGYSGEGGEEGEYTPDTVRIYGFTK